MRLVPRLNTSHRPRLSTRVRTVVRTAVDTVVRAIEHRRKVQLFLVTLVSIATAMWVTNLVSHAQSARDQWGDTTVVLMSSAELRKGDVLSDVNTHLVRVPRMFLAQRALASTRDGARAVRDVGSNTIVTELDIEANAADAPLGWRVVAFPADLVTPELHAGDRVDVVASGVTIANDAVVIAAPTNEHGAEIAVPGDMAAAVAGAAANGDASLVSAG